LVDSTASTTTKKEQGRLYWWLWVTVLFSGMAQAELGFTQKKESAKIWLYQTLDGYGTVLANCLEKGLLRRRRFVRHG